jgi:Fic family protein
MDGNGRTGRMLLNYILLKNDYPPVIIRKKSRKEYLEAMHSADNSNPLKNEKTDYSKLVKFISAELADEYWSLFI